MTTLSEHPDETISAEEAEAQFRDLLRRVSEGHSYTITSHDRPVARIVAPGTPERDKESEIDREEAKRQLLEHLRSVTPLNAGPWTREELYERDIPDAVREAAHEALFKRLESQPAVEVGPWTRDELYDDDSS
jgi:prevent-host-death family protein